jgi:hypothetical protein
MGDDVAVRELVAHVPGDVVCYVIAVCDTGALATGHAVDDFAAR